MQIFICLLVFCCIDYSDSVTTEYPVIEVEYGKLRGHLLQPENGNPYYAFQEIPYAAPPVGNLRFAEPKFPVKWSGIRNATKNTKVCNYKILTFVQPDPRENEDCLYLNVFTPKLVESTNGTLLPVYFYIYGGMYMFGEPTEYNFQGFLDEDIVVVSINYRTALGFLTTGDKIIPGNLGLKDQWYALKWVNRNIAKFGGDPEKVTIGGHSSGAASVGYHLLNRNTKGLYRAGILQSGTPLTPQMFNPSPKYFAYATGEQLSPDFSSKNTSEDLLKLLRSVPVKKILEINLPDNEWFDQPSAGYKPEHVPIVENSNYKYAYVTGPMYDNFEKGYSVDVPIMIGITSEEYLNFANISAVALLTDANFTAVLTPTLTIRKENFLPLAEEIKDFYSKGKSYTDNPAGLLKALGDMYFSMPAIDTAYLRSKFSDVYFYQFSYKSSYNGVDWRKKYPWYKPGVIGLVGHTEELQFMYDYRLDPNVVPTNEDLEIKKKAIKLWTNFIKYTNPTPQKDPLFQNITWPLMKQENFNYVDIDSNMTIRTDPKRFLDWKNRTEKYFHSPRYSY